GADACRHRPVWRGCLWRRPARRRDRDPHGPRRVSRPGVVDGAASCAGAGGARSGRGPAVCTGRRARGEFAAVRHPPCRPRDVRRHSRRFGRRWFRRRASARAPRRHPGPDQSSPPRVNCRARPRLTVSTLELSYTLSCPALANRLATFFSLTARVGPSGRVLKGRTKMTIQRKAKTLPAILLTLTGVAMAADPEILKSNGSLERLFKKSG